MTSERIPDYAACTLSELYLVLNHINRERVPETYEALLSEIENRDTQSSRELLDAWRALDRDRFPEFAARLERQIAAVERAEAAAPPDEETDASTTTGQKRVEVKKYATFWRRLWAGLLDAIVVSIPLEAIGTVLESVGVIQPGSSIFYDDVGYAVLLTYYIALHARYGQTIGKRLTRVKVVDKSEARGITVGQAIRRDIVPVIMFLVAIGFTVVHSSLTPEELENLSTAILVAGAFSVAFFLWFLAEVVTMLFSRKRRAVHDFIAGTVVVRV